MNQPINTITLLSLMLAPAALSGCLGDCPEGFLRDNDGNCLQVDADTGYLGVEDEDEPPVEEEDDGAQVFLCNPLQYSSGASLNIAIDCDGGLELDADSGECSPCEPSEAGEVSCDISIDGEDLGSFGFEVDEGQELAIVFYLDDSSLAVGGVEAPCGSDLEDLF